MQSHDSHVMLPWRLWECRGSWIQDFVGDGFDECHGDHTDRVGLGKFLHHNRNLNKVSINKTDKIPLVHLLNRKKNVSFLTEGVHGSIHEAS